VDRTQVFIPKVGPIGNTTRRRILRAAGGGGLVVLTAAPMSRHIAAKQDKTNAAMASLPPVMTEWVTALQTLDAARAAATYAPDAVREVVPVEQIDRGREQIQDRLQDVHDAFADGTVQIPTVFAVDDQAVAEWVIAAHYTGELPGYPPGSGQPITLRGVSLLSLANGAIVRESLYVDVYGLLVQLGLAPAP
jgi:steroid delta-isomerase-like uncharacterized protein